MVQDMKNKKELIITSSIALISFIVFLVVAIIVFKNNGDLAIDNSIRDTMYDIRGNKGGFINLLFRAITELGYLYVIIIIGIIGIFYTKIDRGLILFVIGYALSITLNVIFKSMYDRPRPEEALQWMVDDEASFPSGHSNTAAFIYSYIVYYLFKTSASTGIAESTFSITAISSFITHASSTKSVMARSLIVSLESICVFLEEFFEKRMSISFIPPII